jgi:hypothetical protein
MSISIKSSKFESISNEILSRKFFQIRIPDVEKHPKNKFIARDDLFEVPFGGFKNRKILKNRTFEFFENNLKIVGFLS